MCLDKFHCGNLLFLVGCCEWAWQIRCTGEKDWMKELLHFCIYTMPSISYRWLILLSQGTIHSSDLYSGCKFKVLLEKQKTPQTQNKPQPNVSPFKAAEIICLIPRRKWTFETENGLILILSSVNKVLACCFLCRVGSSRQQKGAKLAVCCPSKQCRAPEWRMLQVRPVRAFQ